MDSGPPSNGDTGTTDTESPPKPFRNIRKLFKSKKSKYSPGDKVKAVTAYDKDAFTTESGTMLPAAGRADTARQQDEPYNRSTVTARRLVDVAGDSASIPTIASRSSLASGCESLIRSLRSRTTGSTTSVTATVTDTVPATLIHQVVPGLFVAPEMEMNPEHRRDWEIIRPRLVSIVEGGGLRPEGPSGGTLSLQFMMAGPSPSKVKPSVIIFCCNESHRKQLEKIIRSQLWIRELKVKYFWQVVVSPLQELGNGLSDFEGQIVYASTPKGSFSLFGVLAETKESDQCAGATFTIGGIITIGGRPYGTTTRHQFQNTRSRFYTGGDLGDSQGSNERSRLEDDDHDEQEDEKVRESEEYGHGFSPFEFIEDETVQDIEGSIRSPTLWATTTPPVPSNGPMSTAAHMGTPECASADRPVVGMAKIRVGTVEDATYQSESDWALVKLDRGTPWLPNSVVIPGLISIEVDSVFTELNTLRGEVFIKAGVSGLRSGTVHECPAFINSFGRSFKAWPIMLEEPLVPGDSGSWVIQNGTLCGQIVSRSHNVPWVYMIPIDQILREISTLAQGSDIDIPTETFLTNSDPAPATKPVEAQHVDNVIFDSDTYLREYLEPGHPPSDKRKIDSLKAFGFHHATEALRSLAPLENRIPRKLVAWIDERSTTSEQRHRGSKGALSAEELYTELKKPRFNYGSESEQDAERRLVYLTDLDCWSASAVMLVAPSDQQRVLRDWIWSHIRRDDSIVFTQYARQTFALSFHLPFFAWRTSVRPQRDTRVKKTGLPLRKATDLSFLGKVPNFRAAGEEKGEQVWLYEAQISCLVTGNCTTVWNGCFAIDTYFDGDESEDSVKRNDDQRLGQGMFEGNALDCDPSFSGVELTVETPRDPRLYFIKLLADRMEHCKAEWLNVVENLEDAFEYYESSSNFSQGGFSIGTAHEHKTAIQRLHSDNEEISKLFLRLIDGLSANINAWDSFRQKGIGCFDTAREDSEMPRFGEYLDTIHAAIYDLQKLQRKLEWLWNQYKACQNRFEHFLLFQANESLDVQGRATSLLNVMLPIAVASSIMQTQIIPSQSPWPPQFVSFIVLMLFFALVLSVVNPILVIWNKFASRVHRRIFVQQTPEYLWDWRPLTNFSWRRFWFHSNKDSGKDFSSHV